MLSPRPQAASSWPFPKRGPAHLALRHRFLAWSRCSWSPSVLALASLPGLRSGILGQTLPGATLHARAGFLRSKRHVWCKRQLQRRALGSHTVFW